MINELTKHQIFIQRYAGGLYRDLIPQLKEMRDRITQKILNSQSLYQQERLSILLKEIETIISQSVPKLQPSLWSEFAEYENEWSLNLLDKLTKSSVVIGAGLNISAMAKVVEKSLINLADKKPMTIDDMIKVFSDRHISDIKTEIQLGLAEGQTLDEISKRVRYLSNNRTRQQAESLVRTITNHVGSVAREEAFSEYEYLFESEKFIAVLDGRTTLLCGSLDGKLFPIGKAPKPPLHYACRSIVLKQIKEEYSLGLDKKRVSKDGLVPESLTYQQWLKSQSAEVQNEILGKSRAEMFRQNKLTLDKFVDKKGKAYTLTELKQKDGIK